MFENDSKLLYYTLGPFFSERPKTFQTVFASRKSCRSGLTIKMVQRRFQTAIGHRVKRNIVVVGKASAKCHSVSHPAMAGEYNE